MNHWGTRSHAWLYRHSGGRVFGRVGGQPILLLETTGRHSGRPRITPVQYAARGEDFLVVAAHHGARQDPAWYLPKLQTTARRQLPLLLLTPDDHQREDSK